MKGRWLIVLCLFCLPLQAEPFRKSYRETPLAVVLQDIEAHFSCSFLYRPQDIAAASAVTGSFTTDDCSEVLRHVLGEALVVTRRKNILIISPAPPKPKPVQVRSVICAESTIVTNTDTLAPEEPRDTARYELLGQISYLPVELLNPFTPLILRIDTSRIARYTRPRSAIIQPLYNPTYLKHSLLTAVSLGYGSELNAQLDLEYVFFFHKNWGFSSGFALDYAGQYTDSWAHEMRFALPLALRTQWFFTQQWGLQGAAGIQVYFPMAASNGTEAQPFAISSSSVDMAAYAEVGAACVLSPHVTLLFGLYGRFSALALTPWSVGLQVGFQIGK